MKQLFLLLNILVMSLLLTACGQTGKLYLPKPPPETPTSSPIIKNIPAPSAMQRAAS